MGGARRTDAELLRDCVHCGFCLPACPTYVLWGEEMDSPRGRLHLMSQEVGGERLSRDALSHFDRCLGCMACVTACPSGVRYGSLIESARSRIEARKDRGLAERLWREVLFGVLCHPRRLRVAVSPVVLAKRTGLTSLLRRGGLFDRLPALSVMEELVPTKGPLPSRSLGHAASAPMGAAGGAPRARVGLLLGCVQRVLFKRVNEATVRVLAAEGCEVVVPPSQGCCGALSLHAGRAGEARGFARSLIRSFESSGVDYVVANSAGCGSAMKDYGELLADEPGWRERADAFASSVRDFSEILTEMGPVAERHRLPAVVAYHDACHLSHAQRIRDEPRELLGAVPGLELVEIAEAELCCGSAGIYNLTQPETARTLGDRKAAHVVGTGAELVVTSNPGCMMQIDAALRRAGSKARTRHIAEVLDLSISGRLPGGPCRKPLGH